MLLLFGLPCLNHIKTGNFVVPRRWRKGERLAGE
jgi:hypothetical protein